MKNRIIIAVVIVLIAIAGVVGIIYFASFHKISVAFSTDVSGATVFKEKGEEIKKLTAAGEISLQDGNYYIIPGGEKVSKDKIPFSVEGDSLDITLDPDYSSEFLKKALAGEQAAITAAAKKAFPLIAQSYSIDQGTLYRHGEWFGAILTQNTDTRNEMDFYRIILHKEADTWKVVQKPELALTSTEFKDIPAGVLNAVNQLTQ